MKKIELFFKRVVPVLLLSAVVSCGKEDCIYDTVADESLIPASCTLTNSLNLSTGIDAEGNAVQPGDGIIDPYWKVLNNAPLVQCNDPLTATINGSAYLINFANFGLNDWVNMPTATTLAPMNLGTTNSFGCNNALNALGDIIPYVFERPFCVLKNTSVNYNFQYKGDDKVYFQLINNLTDEVLAQSTNYIYPDVPLVWSGTNLSLNEGSYSIRGFLVNVSSVVLGFSFTGTVETADGQDAISNNVDGCCENNTISILNILDENCNQMFDGTDVFGTGWTFKVTDLSDNLIRTGTVNANGNIFFSGLPDGTYKVIAVAQDGYTTSSPAGGSVTVTLANNSVSVLPFYNCH